MGSSISSSLSDQQEVAMLKQMERQIEFQKQLYIKNAALQLAIKRDILNYYSIICAIIFPLMIYHGLKSNKLFLLPILPLSLILSFEYDILYGNKFERIKRNAEYIISVEPKKLDMLPYDFPTITVIH